MTEESPYILRMFELLQSMIIAIGEEIVEAAVASIPADVEACKARLDVLLQGGRDTQILTEACAILIRRRLQL